jgi:hypothetical protein
VRQGQLSRTAPLCRPQPRARRRYAKFVLEGIDKESIWTTLQAKYRHRNDAIIAAYATGAYSYREIAAHFALHLATVGRIMRTRMPQGEPPLTVHGTLDSSVLGHRFTTTSRTLGLATQRFDPQNISLNHGL